MTNLIGMLTKGYLYKNLYKDVSKFVKSNLRDIEFDKDYWLHKAGLSTYAPVKSTIGGVSLFLLGGAIGAVAALMLAPMPGAMMRAEVKDQVRGLVNKTGVAPRTEVPAQA